MSADQKIIQYWYDSLVLGKRSSAEINNDDYLKINFNTLASGRLSKLQIENLLKSNRRSLKKSKNGLIEILICPLIFSSSRKKFGPLWLPAVLDQEGVIKPSKQFIPWISRKYLEPVNSFMNQSFVIGEFSKSESFFEKNKDIKINDWKSAWKFSQILF